MRRGTGCIRRREAFGWGPYPIKATEGRATEGEAGSRATSFGRGKAAECVVEPDAFVDAKHFGWGPSPIAATEGRATEGEAGSRSTSFGRGKAAECVVEPDAFVDAKHLDGAPTPSRQPRAALQKAKPVPGPHPSAVVKRRNASWNRMHSSSEAFGWGPSPIAATEGRAT